MARTAVGMVGLATLLNNCIETLGTLSSAAKHGDNRRILQTKIEVERLRLEVWGECAGLTGIRLERAENETEITDKELAAVDESLRESALLPAVSALLTCFAGYFEDVERLKQRYGLAPTPDSKRSAGSEQPTTKPEVLHAPFHKTYTPLEERITRAQKEGSPVERSMWVVTDEWKFRSFLSALAAINDSLASLLPAIRDQARAQIRVEIMGVNDPGHLKNIIAAADNVKDVFAETASLKFEMLSTVAHRPQVAQLGRGEREAYTSKRAVDDLSVVPSASGLPTSVVQALRATTLDEPLKSTSPPYLSYRNTGALVIHKEYYKHNSLTCHSWLVGVGDAPELSQAQPVTLPAFGKYSLLHFRNEHTISNEYFAQYAGWSPGSTSLTGFAREMTLWKGLAESGSSDEPLRTWRRTGSITLHSDFIDKKWSEILNGLGEDFTNKKGFDKVRELIGQSDFTWLDPNEQFKLRHQITDLLGAMSTSPVHSLETNRSISLLAFHEKINPTPSFGFVDFMRQILLAREALLRIQRDRSRWYGGVTCGIVFDMIASELWAQSMKFVGEGGYKISPDVLRRQLDAIDHFVDQMAWPFASEVQKGAAAIRDSLDSGSDPSFDITLMDWAAGLALPGATFPLTIISALYSLSSSLRAHMPSHVVKARQGDYGIVYPQASYWHVRSVVGKVLAPLSLLSEGTDRPRVTCLGGWVGPCPSVSIPECTFGILISVSARTASFADLDVDQSEQSSLSTASPGTGTRDDDTGTEWTLPTPPDKSTDSVSLQTIRVSKASTDTEPNAKDATPYTVRLDFRLTTSRNFTTFTLSTNSIFVAAPPCRGTHRVPPDQVGNYTFHVHGIESLPRVPKNADGRAGKAILVINATGGVESEVLARAWCCHTGVNAVIWKQEEGRGCFKCALMVASVEGLGIGVVIVC
ncbi:prion-inhibition and propagation-domain-containing protein [Aspergillus recurvatus]